MVHVVHVGVQTCGTQPYRTEATGSLRAQCALRARWANNPLKRAGAAATMLSNIRAN